MSTDKVNAKDRIGNGPWYNFEGKMIAKDVADLHGEHNMISAATALNEMGKKPNYLGGNPPAPLAQPLEHDMMTGTKRGRHGDGHDVQELDGRAGTIAKPRSAMRIGSAAIRA